MKLETIIATAVYYVGKTVANVVSHDYKAVGKGAIPKKEPFVIWADHDSSKNIWEDANLTGRRVVFVTKSEYFRNPIFGIPLRLSHNIRFNRNGTNMEEVYSGIERAVRENVGIIVYPGGTRSKSGMIGPAGRLMVDLAEYVVKLSETYKTNIHLITVGRKATLTNGKRANVTVDCKVAAVATDGRLALTDEGAQKKFESVYTADRGKGFEFFVNGYVMPRIANQSGKEFKPDANVFLRTERDKRRLAARND